MPRSLLTAGLLAKYFSRTAGFYFVTLSLRTETTLKAASGAMRVELRAVPESLASLPRSPKNTTECDHQLRFALLTRNATWESVINRVSRMTKQQQLFHPQQQARESTSQRSYVQVPFTCKNLHTFHACKLSGTSAKA
jgi:hypothetical protein